MIIVRMTVLGAWLLIAQGCAPTYCVVRDEGQPCTPTESISFETSDYNYLATKFVEELKNSRAYTDLTRPPPEGGRTPAVAHDKFRVDLISRATKREVIEQRLRIELQNAGVRYISEQDRESMIEKLKQQNSDLNSSQARAEFGKFANAKFYLKGRVYESGHQVSSSREKREYHLVIDLLDVETLEPRFSFAHHITKYRGSAL